jgi:hypothetical protein
MTNNGIDFLDIVNLNNDCLELTKTKAKKLYEDIYSSMNYPVSFEYYYNNVYLLSLTDDKGSRKYEPGF